MKKGSKDLLILVQSFCLVLSTAICVYAFMSKGRAASAVNIVLSEKDWVQVAPDNQAGASSFWDNYPYLTLASNGRVLKSSQDVYDLSQEKIALAEIISKGGYLFYRHHYSRNNGRVVDSTLSYIKQSAIKICILTDQRSLSYLTGFIDSSYKEAMVYILDKPLYLPIEREGLSFFFTLENDLKVRSIFVPKKEVPGMTTQYLAYFKNLMMQ